ncbi:hypothetical protein LXL04_030253 [Taraxacum kok-saghyz]
MFTGFNELISLNFALQKHSPSTGAIWYAAGPIAVLMFASLVYSISSKNKKELNIGRYDDVSVEIAEAARGSFQRSDDDEVSWKSASDGVVCGFCHFFGVSVDFMLIHHCAFTSSVTLPAMNTIAEVIELFRTLNLPVLFQEDNNDIISEADAKYAEEIQIQEALLASIFSSQTKTNASTSSLKTRSSLSSLLKTTESTETTCKICLENHEQWQMFKNPTCSHSFCYTCTSKHATTKIHESKNTITCPESNCKSTLDPYTLRQIIPKESLIKWDQHLCESMILESQKLYCPFADCSVLLINDDISITNIDCPVCRRAICAVCRVPWHSEFSCKEFGKLKSKRKGKRDDDMALALAKKKKWKKCPMCRFFVEKSEGCLHITCRCEYEFCYNCGGKWSSNHGGCKSRS